MTGFVLLTFLALQSGSIADPGILDAKVATGNDAQRTCKYVASGVAPPEKAIFSTAYCMGYIDAVKEEMDRDRGTAYCSPDGVTLGQTYKVIMLYLDRHPEKLHLPFRQLVAESLREAFPCEIAPGK